MSRIHHGGHGMWVSGQAPCAVAWKSLHFCDLDQFHAGPHSCTCGATLTYIVH